MSNKWISIFDQMPPVGVPVDVWVRLDSQSQYNAEFMKNSKIESVRTLDRFRLGYCRPDVIFKMDEEEKCLISVRTPFTPRYEMPLSPENYEVSHWRLPDAPPLSELEDFANESSEAFSCYLKSNEFPPFGRHLPAKTNENVEA